MANMQKYIQEKKFYLRLEEENYHKLREIAFETDRKVTDLLQEGADYIIQKYLKK